MDGNRGAKGSIKDRIISMLYRNRYKQQKSKYDYTILKKEKQKEYIDNLNRFKETDNLNVLDDIDKNKVSSINIKLNVNQKFFEDKKEIKKIISRDDIKRNQSYKRVNKTIMIKRRPSAISIEPQKLKNNIDKVNLKQENKKVKEEITILKEVNSFINKSKENLDEIKKEVSLIKLELKDKNKDMTNLEERYIKLKNKIDKLKIQYDTIKEKYDLSDFKIIESIKLITSIDNYKSIASLNEIETMVDVCKKEIDNISSINIQSDENNKIGNTLENTVSDQNNIKIKFNKSKSDIENLDLLRNTIEKELSTQEKVVSEMYDKASYINKEIIKTKEYIGKGKILSSLLKITLGMLTVPLTKKRIMGYAVGAVLVNKGLKDLNNNFELKEKIRVNLKYEDISKKISSVSDILDYTYNTLEDSLIEVNKFKKNFINEYSKYSNVLPEFNDNFSKIISLENIIKDNKKKVDQIYKTLEVEKELNNKKLQKVKDIQNKY